MKCVYNAADMLEAHVIVGMLQQHKINGFIEGEYLSGGVGELATQNFVRVMVNNDDFDKGRQLALAYEEANRPEKPLAKPIYHHWQWIVLAIVAMAAAELFRFL